MTKTTPQQRDQRHEIPETLAKKPLDIVVRTLFDVSWTKARDWIAGGKIQLDGVVTVDSRRLVRGGTHLLLQMNAPRPRPNSLEDKRIVFLDTHVVVVNKPPGVSTVPYDESETGTLDERVRDLLARREKNKGARPALGIVHRLDKETSGLLVFTRSWLAKKSLTQQFREHTTKRRYLAIAHGEVKSLTITTHLVQDRCDGLRGSLEAMRARGMRGTGGQEGQLAITHVEALEKLDGATLISCKLETGRTHQIRIHLSESGHPILGDRVYSRHFSGELIPAPRLMLHATELGFVHPATNSPMHWEEPMPDDMKETLTRLDHTRRRQS